MTLYMNWMMIDVKKKHVDVSISNHTHVGYSILHRKALTINYMDRRSKLPSN